MFVKFLMVFSIILVSTQALPVVAPKARQFSKIFALRAERTLHDDVAKAIEDCQNSTNELLIENSKISKQIEMFDIGVKNLDSYFYAIVDREFFKGNATCTEYFEKAEELGVDIETCYWTWWNTNYLEATLVQLTIFETGKQYVTDHMIIWSQNSRELITIRYDLLTVELEAWACGNDECLEIILKKVKVFEEYINGDLSPKIINDVDEVVTSSGQVLNGLFRLADGLVPVMDAVTNDFVKCAEDILGY